MTTLPLLSELVSNILNDIQSEFGVTISDEQQVALRAVATTEAGQQWLQYKVLAFVQKQIWPDTADSEDIGGTLERFARSRLKRNRFPAIAGEYTVSVTGSTGAVLEGQTTIYKSDDTSANPGYLYVLDNTYTLVSTSDVITVRAMIAGVESRLNIGDTLTITSPVPLVGGSITVLSESVQPLAGETIEELRTDVLNSLTLEAQGGASTDYRIWSGDAQGVKQVYPYANPVQENSLNLYVEANIVDSEDGKGTPGAAILAAVEAVVNFSPDTSIDVNERGRRPATVIVYPLPTTPLNVDVIVTGGSFSASQQTNITTALTAAINAVRPFVPAAAPISTNNSVLDTNKINGVIYAAVPGAVYTGATLTVNAVTLLSYTFMFGDIPYVNSISFS